MAFAITNFSNPFTAVEWIPGKTSQKADVSTVDGSAQTAVDLGSASYKFMRVIVYVKTLTTLVATDTFTFTVQTGTSTAVTSPKNILQKSVTMATGDTAIVFEIFAIAQTAFQSYQVLVGTTSSHTCTYDYQIEVA
jgi:hypothetical protein